jgi:hypothetical protein
VELLTLGDNPPFARITFALFGGNPLYATRASNRQKITRDKWSPEKKTAAERWR